MTNIPSIYKTGTMGNIETYMEELSIRYNHGIPIIVLIVLIQIVSILGNGLVLAVVLRDKTMRTVTNYLICNLALSDTILAGMAMPLKLHDIGSYRGYSNGNFLCVVDMFLPIVCVTASSYSLVMLSIDRYRGIVQNIRPTFSSRQLTVTVSLVWIFSFLAGVPALLQYSVYPLDKGNFTIIVCGSHENVPNIIIPILDVVFLVLVCYIAPLTIILIKYVQVAKFVNKRENQISSTVGHSFISKHKVKVVKLLVITAAIFATLWVQFFTLYAYEKVTGQDDNTKSGTSFHLTELVLLSISTAYNPFLYAMYNRKFRHAYLRLLRKFCRPCMTKDALNQVAPVHDIDNTNLQSMVTNFNPSRHDDVIVSTTTDSRLREGLRGNANRGTAVYTIT